MKSSRLAVMALAATVLLTGPAFGLRYLVQGPPAPKRPADKPPVSDPAEPPMTVLASYDDKAPDGAPRIPRGGRTGRPVAVAGGPKGVTLTLDTLGTWQGWSTLTFKNAAPPMRFTLRLAKMPSYDLGALTLASGNVSLTVESVSASPTTRYFDAKGRALKGPEGAAYTLTARRWDGEVDVEVRRAPGAALGKELTISWKSRLVYGGGLRGG
jgi:hypothetical protein